MKFLQYIFTVVLNRFDFDPETMEKVKLNHHVSFPFQLSMDKYLKGSSGEQQEEEESGPDAQETLNAARELHQTIVNLEQDHQGYQENIKEQMSTWETDAPVDANDQDLVDALKQIDEQCVQELTDAQSKLDDLLY
eukprot:TRINITY_DN7553_c1_g1_i1.p2 TRINITY_DN7553_c1_g1~~TRINITY_DN7553_c1_g1_i1.p2  ORF type:complete len:136 (-),score=60.87 TRINITY_DN7553_c1_g1_i1:11-418(-)